MTRKFIALACFLLVAVSNAQTKQLQYGIPFTVTVPDYMARAVGLNDDACLQFKDEVKEVYGIVIEDNKEELQLAELNFTSLKEYSDSFRKNFLADEATKKISDAVMKRIGETGFSEFDATYTDKEDGLEIYYLVGLVETKKAYYKVLLWTIGSQKATYKEDFKKILYSFKG